MELIRVDVSKHILPVKKDLYHNRNINKKWAIHMRIRHDIEENICSEVVGNIYSNINLNIKNKWENSSELK